MNYNTLERKLEKLKEKYKEDEEVWVKIPNFWNYEISTFGRIKSLKTTEKRKSPRGGKVKKYTRKESVLKPLYIGEDRRWVAAKLSVKQGVHKQLSVAKLLLSALLKISVYDLPHSIYFLDWDSHNVNLHNLTFIRKNIGK